MTADFPPDIAPLIREGTEALVEKHFLYAANCFCLARHKMIGAPKELREQLAKLHKEALIFHGQAASELR